MIKKIICKINDCKNIIVSHNKCREHYNEYQRQYREKNIEKIREISRKSRIKRYEEDIPTKIRNKANELVKNSIKKNIIKKLPCKKCGSKISQAHHSSYKKEDWLNIIWLCKDHHNEWHRKNNPIYDKEVVVDKFSKWKKNKPISNI